MPEDASKEIKVSVIMPVYNVEQYLGECMDSVLSQTLRDIEVICIDDGSTDSAVEILEDYRSRDERVVILRQENSGAGKARNKGLGNARGTYIAFMDADDRYPDNEVLEKLVSAAERHSVSISGGSRLRDTSKGLKKKKSQTFEKEEVIYYKDFQQDYDYQCYIFERKLLTDNNITFPYYRRYQDPPFFVRAMIAAEKFCIIPDVTYVYRVDPAHVKWDEIKTEHLIRAITECLQLSSENGLEQLHYKTVTRLEKEYRKQIIDNCCRRVVEALLDAEKAIDVNLYEKGARCAGEDSEEKSCIAEDVENKGRKYRLAVLTDMLSACRYGEYRDTIKELNKTKKELARIKNSRSYKLIRLFRRK